MLHIHKNSHARTWMTRRLPALLFQVAIASSHARTHARTWMTHRLPAFLFQVAIASSHARTHARTHAHTHTRTLMTHRLPALLFQVAIASSFEKVKAVKCPAYETLGLINAGSSMWRRGVVGDWRRHFTPEMNAEIDAKIKSEWEGTPLIEYFNYG